MHPFVWTLTMLLTFVHNKLPVRIDATFSIHTYTYLFHKWYNWVAKFVVPYTAAVSFNCFDVGN